jgi:hypothetical protein
MALPIGFGEIISAIEFLKSVYDSWEDAPRAFEEAMTDVQSMEKELEALERMSKDKKSSFYKNKSQMYVYRQ